MSSSEKKHDLPDVMAQAKGFRAYREARRHVIIEDYVELIDDLLQEGREARQVDIAERLGVSQPTVAKVLTRLVEEDLITRKPYRGVFLTDKGQKIAERSRRRHRVVERFFHALGIDDEVSSIDAEAIEHYVSEETLAAFETALEAGIAAFMKKSGKKRL